MSESRWNVGDAVTESAQGPITRLKHVRVALKQSIDSEVIHSTRLQKSCKESLDIRLAEKYEAVIGI